MLGTAPGLSRQFETAFEADVAGRGTDQDVEGPGFRENQ